jgi:uncharacterized protein YndB with AHSA1/START domain
MQVYYRSIEVSITAAQSLSLSLRHLHFPSDRPSLLRSLTLVATITSLPIRWRLRLRSAPEAVYDLIATPAGRARFWADAAEEREGLIDFRFSNGQRLASHVLERTRPSRFRLTYFGGSEVTFDLAPVDGDTDLTLTETGVPPEERAQNEAGWVSVLLTLKAAADFGVDLRSHEPGCTWEQGYVDV